MATRRGGETISVRQFDWHKRFHHRLLAHPGYQGLNFERRGIYNHLYDLAAVANDDGAIRIGAGERFTKRRLVEFLAMLQAGPAGDSGQHMNWARQAVDALLVAELVRVDGKSTLWLVNYADEQAAISPAGMRKRAQRDRAAGGGESSSIEEGDGGAADAGGRGPWRSAPPPSPGSDPLTRNAGGFDDVFDTGSDGVGEGVGQSRDGHDQRSEVRDQRRGTNVPQNQRSEADVRRAAAADGRPRFDAAALNGSEPGEGGGGSGGVDIYSLPIVDAACRVMRNHGQWSVNVARKAVRELGEQIVWNVIGEVDQAWKDGVVKARDKATGRPTGGPLFSHACERYRARAGVAAMAGQTAANRPPIGFGG